VTRRRSPGPRMTPRDLAGEALAGLLARPARVALTVLGTVIGVGALVATLGLSKTAGNQIIGRFSEVAATDVLITPAPGATSGGSAARIIPWDAEERLERLNGVAAAGTLS
jgi:macrolide transport system ATP-binding/permease protein